LSADYSAWFDFWPPYGCWHAIEADGTFSPSVVLPGIELSESQRERLAAILALPEEVGSCCPGDDVGPRVSFVFYDASGQPSAEARYVRLDALVAWGRIPGRTTFLSEDAMAKAHQLFRDIGILLPEGTFEHVKQAAWTLFRERTGEGHWVGPNTDPIWVPAFGVAEDAPLKTIDAIHRRRLCAWSAVGATFAQYASYVGEAPNERHAFRLGERSTNGEQANDNGPWGYGRIRSWQECQRDFPECDVRLSEALRCHLIVDSASGSIAGEEFASCWPIRHCLWAYEIEDPRPGPLLR
jgi:hypothetical protein